MSSPNTSVEERDKLLSSTNDNKYSTNIEANLPNTEKDTKTSDKGTILIVAFVLMLIVSLGNRIYGKLATYPMYNYPIFFNFLTTVVYVPLSFAYILPMMKFSNVITQEQRDIPKYKFAIMGALDSVAGVMYSLAVNYMVSAGLIVMVQQAAIPISMVISKYSLNATYTKPQYAGAAVVMIGIIVVLIPTLIGKSSASSSSDLSWSVLLVLSCVPMCFSSVYKEKALGEMDIDVVYLNGWVGIFQTIFAIPLSLPSASMINIPYSEIIPSFYYGSLCLMGHNTILETSAAHPRIDNCADGPLFVGIYIAFNVVFNILIIVILKYGSANILFLSSTVIIPFSNIIFSLKVCPNHQPMSSASIYGLLVIMVGLTIYRFYTDIEVFLKMKYGWSLRDDDDDLVALNMQDPKTVAAYTSISSKQLRMIGLNQMEALNSIVSYRIDHESKMYLKGFRSEDQARGLLLHRLGIPPSPKVSRNKSGGYQMSPQYNQRNSPTMTSTGVTGGVGNGKSNSNTNSPQVQGAGGAGGGGRNKSSVCVPDSPIHSRASKSVTSSPVMKTSKS